MGSGVNYLETNVERELYFGFFRPQASYAASTTNPGAEYLAKALLFPTVAPPQYRSPAKSLGDLVKNGTYSAATTPSAPLGTGYTIFNKDEMSKLLGYKS